MPTLLDLEARLDHAKAPLPKKVQITPNQHSWLETAVMISKLKTKQKGHTDPYSGRERSRKRAKPDMRVVRTTQSNENTLTPTIPPIPAKLVIRIPRHQPITDK